MDLILPILALALSLGMGAALGFMYARHQGASARRELEHAVVRLEAEKQATLAAAASMKTEFEALAAAALKSNNESFVALARQSLEPFQQRATHELQKTEKNVENVVRPLKEALARADAQIAALEKQRAEAYGNLQAQVKHMQEGQAALSSETRNLVNALRRPEARGRWGENTLKNVVELAGMVEHCDFELQQTATDAALRPDMIVRVPGERIIVVDAKTPLDAYLDAHNARDDVTREAALVRHARQVRDRMRELSSKEYTKQFPNSLDYTVLFVPGDHFLAAAYERDHKLQDDAHRYKVLLASPSSLMALLNVIAYSWRQQTLAENADAIRGIGADLYQRLTVFAGHIAEVGKALNKAVDSHNAALSSFETRLLPGARKFAELGVETKAELPKLEPIERKARLPHKPDPDA